jgi:RNA polymerase sigma-70 factor (ECF subfamily)
VRVSTALAPALPADATRLLYEQHSSRIFGFCLSRLGSREEAEDAVQTTFLNAQRGLGRGVVPEYELAWLFKIAQNVCHNRHQSAQRRGRLEATQDLDALQDVLATPERGGSVALGDLTRALSAVPERQRRALLLREFQGLSYEEIGAELGISVAAVETLIFRARRSVAAEVGRLETTPSTRRGALAFIAELFRWFLQGGAAPVKLAAAAATVATAGALTVAPALDRHSTTPVVPSVVTGTQVVPAASTPPQVVQATVPASSASRPPAVSSGSASPASPSSPAVQAASMPGRTDPPVPGISPAVGVSQSVPAVSIVPAPLPVPESVSTPPLTVPGVDLGVSLPAVTLPDVQETLPTLPTLPPKLP